MSRTWVQRIAPQGAGGEMTIAAVVCTGLQQSHLICNIGPSRRRLHDCYALSCGVDSSIRHAMSSQPCSVALTSMPFQTAHALVLCCAYEPHIAAMQFNFDHPSAIDVPLFLECVQHLKVRCLGLGTGISKYLASRGGGGTSLGCCRELSQH